MTHLSPTAQRPSERNKGSIPVLPSRVIKTAVKGLRHVSTPNLIVSILLKVCLDLSGLNNIQLYCPRWEISLAVIGTRRNIKRPINVIILEIRTTTTTTTKRENNWPLKKSTSRLKYVKSLRDGMHTHTHINNTPLPNQPTHRQTDTQVYYTHTHLLTHPYTQTHTFQWHPRLPTPTHWHTYTCTHTHNHLPVKKISTQIHAKIERFAPVKLIRIPWKKKLQLHFPHSYRKTY